MGVRLIAAQLQGVGVPCTKAMSRTNFQLVVWILVATGGVRGTLA
jgi:hypothetical protein